MALKRVLKSAFCILLAGSSLAEGASKLQGSIVESYDVDPDPVNQPIDDNLDTGHSTLQDVKYVRNVDPPTTVSVAQSQTSIVQIENLYATSTSVNSTLDIQMR